MMDPKQVVREGYEHAAPEYERWSRIVDAAPRARYLALVSDVVDPGATILELGCGTGLATCELSARFHVVAVDFAAACLRLARATAPRASYVRADMTLFHLRPRSVDAVVAFYSLIHVPRDEQGAVLRRAAEWLRPNGLVLATMGAHDLPAGTDDDWRGVPMYWSSYDRDTNVELVRDAGFDIVRADEVPQREDGKVVSFLWVVGRLAP